MPSVLVSTKRLYVIWRIPKGVTLLAAEDNTVTGPEKPWSWYCHWNTLTYWDDKGEKYEIQGIDSEPDYKRHEEVEVANGEEWGMDSDEE